MTWLPHSLEPFRDEASSLIKNGAIKALEFSGRTYQLHVFDPQAEETYWSFLHLNESGAISDSFCLCSEENESSSCAHLAASFLKIYNGRAEPLHVRYETSFWRALFLNIDKKLGSSLKALKKEKVFALKPLNKNGEAYLKELATKSVPPTEETSLKFSDLTEEELSQLRHGEMTPKLHYEFSFWSDLAKTLLLIQENHEFLEIHFKGDPIPLELRIKTKDLDIKIHLNEKELLALIPYLNTIESNLHLMGSFKDQVESASFDPVKHTMTLGLKKEDPEIKKLPLFHGYRYVKDKGFINEKTLPLVKSEIKEITPFLNLYQNDLNAYIPIKNVPIRLKTHVAIDQGVLKLTPYFSEPGDLEKASDLFENWLFHEGTFFRLIDPPSTLSTTKIPRADVYDYVMTHQAFLNGIKGFKVHLKPVEAVLSYKIDEHGSLIIHSGTKNEDIGQSIEYGQLVYIKGQGFFNKRSLETNLPLDTPILAHKIPQFIRQNEKELRLIPGFFLEKTPLHQAKLHVEVTKDGILVTPKYEWEESFKHTPYHFYEDYLYLSKKGFYPISPRNFIPLAFREPELIKEKNYAEFFQETLNSLEPYIEKKDPRLIPPKNLFFKFSDLVWDDVKKGYVGSLFINGEIPFPLSQKRFHFTSIGLIDTEKEPLKKILKTCTQTYPVFSSLEILKMLALYDLEPNLPILKEFNELKTDIPLHHEALKSKLRPYQEVGVKWLWFLYTHRLSGLLSDDMGLGKTHQAMALMASIKAMKNSSKFLVVAPTSVLHHWEDKLKAFFPALKIFTYHGLKRDIKEAGHQDLILTSYGVLRNEIEHFKNLNFELAVFDEIQLAKNHLSRLHLSLKQIKATTRLGLTGTPIENRLRELKALFDIVLPGLMPGEQEYYDDYVRPIERGEDKESKSRLSRLIKPFLLRRKKEDVLLDLPEKIEEISHADLIESQETLYAQVSNQARQSLISDLYDENKIIPYIHIFALLSNLKKICNHPALFLKDVANYKNYPSGKWDLFKELLEEALASEQKVVVFSHFLGMLDIIEAHLTEEGIGFASLRGSTVNRKDEIHRFQKDPNCKVFVASLQAGGLGIDLTQASVVIHYDRWWNAARENQATDRVHRIGQTRGVQVFKLVTLKTVEERIHEMIEKKSKRMEEIVGADDSQVIKSLSRDELIELLRTQ